MISYELQNGIVFGLKFYKKKNEKKDHSQGFQNPSFQVCRTDFPNHRFNPMVSTWRTKLYRTTLFHSLPMFSQEAKTP